MLTTIMLAFLVACGMTVVATLSGMYFVGSENRPYYLPDPVNPNGHRRFVRLVEWDAVGCFIVVGAVYLASWVNEEAVTFFFRLPSILWWLPAAIPIGFVCALSAENVRQTEGSDATC